MAHFSIRMTQPGQITPHHQQSPIMVSMTQPPPISMPVSPMMGRSGGMNVVNQAVNHQEIMRHQKPTGSYRHRQTHPPHLSHSSSNSRVKSHVNFQTNKSHMDSHPSNLVPHSGQTSNMKSLHHHAPQSHNACVSNNSSSDIPSNSAIIHNSQAMPMANVSQGDHKKLEATQKNLDCKPKQPSFSAKFSNLSKPSISYLDENCAHPNESNEILPSDCDNIDPRRLEESNSQFENETAPENDEMWSCDADQLTTKLSSTSREKTPMCLVNELARYNKVPHQYCLTDEQGPAHKKTFIVTLKMGSNNEEQYSASGLSIKKAQHFAAAKLLKNTKFKQPPPKSRAKSKQTIVTPTVELNALAMKRGEQAVYSAPTCIKYSRIHHNGHPHHHSTFNHIYDHRRFYQRSPAVLYPPYFVHLKIGEMMFDGEGTTPQLARHNAASKALDALKSLPPMLPKESSDDSKEAAANDCSTVVDKNGVSSNDHQVSATKSPISIVHEIALKRHLSVHFEVISETGPPHMRIFVTNCKVGDILTEGRGSCKKTSKKCAAQLMVEELKKLPSLPVTASKVKVKLQPKKKGRNSTKVQKTSSKYVQNVNSIARLIQIQQAMKVDPPVYQMISDEGSLSKREFVIQVNFCEESARGSGPNKKAAKKNAAENMLQILGYTDSTGSVKPAIKKEKAMSGQKVKQGNFHESCEKVSSSCDLSKQSASVCGGTGGRQIVPGLIVVSNSTNHGSFSDKSESKASILRAATVASELLKPGEPSIDASASPSFELSNHNTKQLNGNFKTVTNISENADDNGAAEPSKYASSVASSSKEAVAAIGGTVVSPKDQLSYLAELLHLKVEFSDFPNMNRDGFLSLVSLSTVPPHVSHGVGKNISSARDQACLKALQSLAELGLDSLTSAHS